MTLLRLQERTCDTSNQRAPAFGHACEHPNLGPKTTTTQPSSPRKPHLLALRSLPERHRPKVERSSGERTQFRASANDLNENEPENKSSKLERVAMTKRRRNSHKQGKPELGWMPGNKDRTLRGGTSCRRRTSSWSQIKVQPPPPLSARWRRAGLYERRLGNFARHPFDDLPPVYVNGLDSGRARVEQSGKAPQHQERAREPMARPYDLYPSLSSIRLPTVQAPRTNTMR